jgi:multidrug efflux pump subunit AcrA (membrane-fusion protein)
MTDRDIFRKKPLEKLNRHDELDELLQVNSVHTWLIFGAIIIVFIGLLMWAIMGTITNSVKGVGFIKTQDLPREVLATQSGQIDSVFIKIGECVESGQRIMKIFQIESQTYTDMVSPFSGQITGLNIMEGDYIKAGSPVTKIMRIGKTEAVNPELIFFVGDRDISKLKTGMEVFLKIDRETIPLKLLKYRIVNIANYPASESTFAKYFSVSPNPHSVNNSYFEVRALLIINLNELSVSEKEILMKLNGFSCSVTVTVSRQNPATYFFNSFR